MHMANNDHLDPRDNDYNELHEESLDLSSVSALKRGIKYSFPWPSLISEKEEL